MATKRKKRATKRGKAYNLGVGVGKWSKKATTKPRFKRKKASHSVFVGWHKRQRPKR